MTRPSGPAPPRPRPNRGRCCRLSCYRPIATALRYSGRPLSALARAGSSGRGVPALPDGEPARWARISRSWPAHLATNSSESTRTPAESFDLLGDCHHRHRGAHREDKQECGIEVICDLASGLVAADGSDFGCLLGPRLGAGRARTRLPGESFRRTSATARGALRGHAGSQRYRRRRTHLPRHEGFLPMPGRPR